MALPTTPTPAPAGQLPTRERVLAAGLEWLYATEQPDDALLMPTGVALPAAGNLTLTFTPLPAATPTVIVEVTTIEWTPHDGGYLPANTFGDTPHQTAAELEQLGAGDANLWQANPGLCAFLYLHRPAHPSLLAAAERYGAGCLEHPERGAHCICGWYAAGAARLTLPSLDLAPAQEVQR